VIRVVVFLIGFGLMGWVTLSWLDPARQPSGIVGLNPDFQEIDDLYDAALEAGQPEQALEWIDEFLLSSGGGSVHARRAWDMRDAARLQGAEFHGVPADRGQGWRLERVLDRRPMWETGLAVTGSVLFWAALLSLLFTRKTDEEGPILPPPEHVERVYGPDS
jgi:hypothetical protein